MGRKLILETEKISVWCYPLDGVIHHEMHGHCHSEPFRKGLEAGTEAMRKYKANCWLSDDRANGPLSPEDEEWATKVWFPMTKAAGWKFWAMVQPVKVIGQMNVARFLALYSKQGITAQIFTEPDAALSWLLEQRDAAR